MIHWPAGLGPDTFLRDYWQRAPLLLPGALPGLDHLPSPEELAGLACEHDVESRLVCGSAGSGWRVRHGPFDENEFLTLPERGWTLLVQDVEKHLPALSALVDAFDFVPRWRRDDLMISYAASDGSVGPHVDAYDVFLVQGRGHRRWELGARPEDPALRDDSDLRVLRRFEPTARHLVAPGDVLYLPPGVAHHGYSDEPSMTCSIGFRAPSAAELLAAAARLLDEGDPLMYSDPGLAAAEVEGSRISARALDRLRNLLAAAMELVSERADTLLGRLATEGKPWLLPEPRDEPSETEEIDRRLRAGARLHRHPGSRFAWIADGSCCRLFVDGEAWRLSATATAACRQVADGASLDLGLLTDDDGTVAALLADLVTRGCLVWDDSCPGPSR